MSNSASRLATPALSCVFVVAAAMASANQAAAQAGPGTMGPDGAYRVGNGVSAPSLSFKVEPEYSETARKLRASGRVVLSIVIQPDGTARDFKVVGSIGYGLDEKAIECVRKWRFNPAAKDGKGVPVAAQIEVNFRLLVREGEADTWFSGPMVFASEAGMAPPAVKDGRMPKPVSEDSNESVVLEFTVDSSGSVKDIHSIYGSESASKLLTPYLATWKFRPAVKDNRSIERTGRVRFVKGQGDEASKLALTPPLTQSIPVPSTGAARIRTMVNPTDGQKYVWIPPGAFTMGCSPGDTECAGDEKPPHAERVENGFWLGQTEVTQAAYLRVNGGNPSTNKGDQFPVESLTWHHAANYCTAIGGRLPTEVEWEYAARAGSTWARYGSLDEVAWHSGNSGGATHPVAMKQPNAFGLYDMLGNVWEYVAGSYPGSSDKIERGGSPFVDIRTTRASSRGRSAPSATAIGRGFRCAGEWSGAENTPSAPPVITNPIPTVTAPRASPHGLMVNAKDGQRYVWIPPGAFTMGCSQGDTECQDNEEPAHAQAIENGFWLGQTEVTQEAYQRVTKNNPSYHGGDQLPVDSVTWNEANQYCGSIGGHLPTEAEWEYAARGQAGVTAARYGSLDAVAWHSGNSDGTTHPVGQKQPNAVGLYDMLGNVWEWVDDTSAGDSIMRGGSSQVYPGNVRASVRSVVPPSDSSPNRGFRSAGEWPAEEMTAPVGSAGTAPPTVGDGGGPGNEVYRAGNGVSAPEILYHFAAEYSAAARQARVEGTVLLYIQVDPSGKAINMRVMHSLGLGLDEKAMEAVKKWKFKPGYKDGKPVTTETQIDVNFRLNE